MPRLEGNRQQPLFLSCTEANLKEAAEIRGNRCSTMAKIVRSETHLGIFALHSLWGGSRSLSRRAWSRMAVPVFVYASQPPRVGLLRAGWFRNDWRLQSVL